MTNRRPFAFAALVSLPVLLLACGGDGGGTTGVGPPSAMQKTAGDNQSGPPGTALPTKLEVKVTDDQGRAVSGFTVSFSATEGSLSPQSMDTDSDGRARTTLTLPGSEATVTVTASGAGVSSVQFTASSVPEQLGLVTAGLPAGRTGIDYDQSLEAVGGSGTGYSFAVTGGALPPGVQLQSDGTFTGAPTGTGTFAFTLAVTDSEDESATRAMSVEVCGVPADLAPGDVRVLEPSELGECGAWIPNDQADRYYRLGVIRTNEDAGTLAGREVTTTVSAFGVTAGASPVAALAAPSSLAGPLVDGALLRRLREARARQAATARLHERLLRQADDMRRAFGRGGLVRPAEAPSAVAPVDLADEITIRVSPASTCGDWNDVQAINLGENDRVAIFQDAGQFADTETRVESQAAQMLLDYFEAYGEPVIDAFFDGVPDIDSNGKVIVFISPEAAENVLGFVWPGDMYDRSVCEASNEGELIYLGVTEILALTDVEAQFGLGLAALVHEMKHVSSLWERLQRDIDDPVYNPLWLEEGGAEIAATKAARLAWEARGGPAATERVTEEGWRLGDSDVDLDSENVNLLLNLFRIQEALFEHPNSIIVNTGFSDDVYGTGWIFLRWLADAYGDAATGAMAEASLFADLNDRSTPSGVAGIEAVTGRTWETLLGEFLAASMHNGTPVQDDVDKGFTGWDFISSIELWCFAVDPFRFYGGSSCNTQGAEPGPPGAFPWPVTVNDDGSQMSVFLEDAVFRGDAGQGGFRVHDFFTNGTGSGAEVTVEVQTPARVVLVRVR